MKSVGEAGDTSAAPDEGAIYVISPIVESDGVTQDKAQHYLDDQFGHEKGIRLISQFLDYGPTSIENEIDDALCVPNLLEKAMWAQNNCGARGTVIDCMCDPGITALRRALDIPVLGPAEIAFHIAASLGRRFSVIDIGSDTGPMLEDQVKRYGLTSKFASVRGTGIAMEEIGFARDSLHRILFEQAVQSLEEDGADVIVLGCTGFTGTARAVQEELKQEKGYDVPVIDPLPLAIHVLIAMLKAGYCHSKAAYPTPGAKKRLKGYSNSLSPLYRRSQ